MKIHPCEIRICPLHSPTKCSRERIRLEEELQTTENEMWSRAHSSIMHLIRYAVLFSYTEALSLVESPTFHRVAKYTRTPFLLDTAAFARRRSWSSLRSTDPRRTGPHSKPRAQRPPRPSLHAPHRVTARPLRPRHPHVSPHMQRRSMPGHHMQRQTRVISSPQRSLSPLLKLRASQLQRRRRKVSSPPRQRRRRRLQ